MNEFTIPGKLAGLNEYTRACRSHWNTGRKMKREQENIVGWEALRAKIQPITKPVKIYINWLEPDRRRDVDNIVFAQKFILDALVRMKILPDDSQKWVIEIINTVELDKSNPRVTVRMEEV